jgi:Protein of unknown function (DUF1553)/Protein of unknown function (DUF1549)
MRYPCLLCVLLLAGPVSAAAPPSLTHWAFRPPTRPTPPSTSPGCRNPIDAFLRARLHSAGLEPANPAARAVLLRRVSFDLTGLPPTPEEVRTFLTDERPDAYERIVDRLLARPTFGERWAQHWLDVVRHAETNGYELDAERPQSWRYRDYVAAAFNADRPYNTFVAEQIAGDLLAPRAPEAERANLWIAAGFNRCGPAHVVGGNIDPAEVRQEALGEMVTGLSAFLGLTVACARCHDHKFDPLSQREYYQLEAFFSMARPKEVDLASNIEGAAYTAAFARFTARQVPLRSAINAIDAPYRSRLSAAKRAKLELPYRQALDTPHDKRTEEQKRLASQAQTLLKVSWDELLVALTPADRDRRAQLRQQLHDLDALRPQPPARAWTLAESEGPLETHILKRGNLHRPGARVTPGFPAVVGKLGEDGKRLDREALARWLTRPGHPLTARVIVNRLWQHHFGRGLVPTTSDFGTHGERPSHPELLDWLACELVESGWSLKHIHRLMVTSAAYQQESLPSAKARSLDPENRLLSHMNRQRLEGETLRDAVLAVSGALRVRFGGPSVRVPLEPEVYALIFTEDEPDGLWPVTPDPEEHNRRSLYLFAKRNVRLPLLETFDQPDSLTSCPVRPVSTFAPQALILFNGPFLHRQANVFAQGLLRETNDNRALIERAYQRALGRPPSPAEMRQAVTFLDAQTELIRDRLRARETIALPDDLPAEIDPAQAAAVADFCLALLNRNAFVYVE